MNSLKLVKVVKIAIGLTLALLWLPESLSAKEIPLIDFLRTRQYNIEVRGNREIYTRDQRLTLEFQSFNRLFKVDKYVYFFKQLPVWKNNRIHVSEEDIDFLTKIVDYYEKKSRVGGEGRSQSPSENVDPPPAKTIPKSDPSVGPAAEEKTPDKGSVNKLGSEEKREIAEKGVDDLYRSTAAQKIDYVFIDPGHGGHDPGATFYGFVEKDLTLSLSRELAQILQEKNPDFKIVLTRNDDTYLSLEERCVIANETLKPEENGIFISVHLNVWVDPQARGIEAFYLTGNEDVIQKKTYRHLEDLVSGEESYFKKIFGYLKVIQYQMESRYLSSIIIKNIESNVKASIPRGYKHETFYVLKGVLMPAVLLELGFLSNRKDMEFLSNAQKRRRVLEQVGSAIISYSGDFKKSNGFRDNFYFDKFLTLD